MSETMNFHVLIRADAGGSLGTGHVARMLALAQAISAQGGTAIFACASCPEPLAQRLRDQGFPFHAINAEPGSAQDAAQTLELARREGAPWAVLDGYHFRETYQATLKKAGLKVLCVDDYGHCEVWNADAVLNHNLYAPERSFTSTVEGFSMLRGTHYALLRQEFLNQPPWEPKPGRLENLLVTMGGVDADNATARVLDLLESVEGDPLHVRVIAGAGNPNLGSLLQHQSRHHLEIIPPVDDMPSQFRWADGIISAGGGTYLEWLLFHLKAAVVTIADNQEPVVAELRRQHLAVCLGWPSEWQPPTSALALLQRMIDNSPPEEVRFPEIDGYGAHRVAAFLGGRLLFRPAAPADARRYFDWANDPAVRANSLTRDEITWENHFGWFQRRLADGKTRLWVCEDPLDGPVGQVRFEPRPEGGFQLSYSLDGRFRGRGLALPVLSGALQRLDCQDGVFAQIKRENPASLKALERAGFRILTPDGPADQSVVEMVWFPSTIGA